MTMEQWNALSFGYKLAMYAFVLGGFMVGAYKASKAGAQKGTASTSAATAAVATEIRSENKEQTKLLHDLHTGMLAQSIAVGQLGERFTIMDARQEREASEARQRLAQHAETLKTHADQLYVHDLKIKVVEDGLARAQTVIGMRSIDRSLASGLVAALTPDPPKQDPPEEAASAR